MSSWFLVPKPRPAARLRLFCIPHAGRGASLYHPWAARLPDWVELTAVQLPGRETRLREAPLRRLDAIVESLLPEVLARIDRPFALFGHSMGALLAFELARALRRLGAPPPVGLFLSGRRAPGPAHPAPHLHALPDDRFVEEVGRRYGGLPQLVLDEPELLRMVLPILRADFEVIETHAHRPEPPLPLPFHLYGGTKDPQSAPEQVAGWRAQTTAAQPPRLFPGGHFYLQDQPDAVVAALSADLERLMVEAGGI